MPRSRTRGGPRAGTDDAGAGPPVPPAVARGRAARAGVGAIFFSNGAAFATWASRVPDVRDALDLTPGGLSVALTGLAAGALAGLPLAGLLVARIGSRRILAGAGIYLGALPLVGLAPQLLCLTGALTFFAITNSCVDVAMNTQGALAERLSARPLMGGFHARFSLGGVTGAAAGGLAVHSGLSPETHFMLAAVLLTTLCLVATAFLPPDPPGSDRPGLALVRPGRGVWTPGLVAFCALMGEGTVNDWGSIYLRDVAGAPTWLAAAGFAVFSAGMVTGRLVADRIRAGTGSHRYLFGCAALAASGAVLALALPFTWTSLAGYALIGLGLAAVVPVTYSHLARRTPGSPGPAIAAASTIGYVGFLAGPPIIGALNHAAGLHAVMVVFLVLMIIVVALAPRLRDELAEQPAP
ncbi:MFS transporter [Actinomadura nitritigenes]|uniref:MFS transporter n=2 Tax=Actinomadura nitritigenes TaxID=134602 RepID=UPI003D8CA5BA